MTVQVFDDNVDEDVSEAAGDDKFVFVSLMNQVIQKHKVVHETDKAISNNVSTEQDNGWQKLQELLGNLLWLPQCAASSFLGQISNMGTQNILRCCGWKKDKRCHDFQRRGVLLMTTQKTAGDASSVPPCSNTKQRISTVHTTTNDHMCD